MSAMQGNDSLNAKGWIGDKSCIMTMDNGASLKIAKPVITAGLPESKLTQPYVLQMVSGGAH
jgi:hypothetical protein